MELGIYIHVPFCRTKCDYCSFYSIPVNDDTRSKNKNIIELYIDALKLEIDKKAFQFKGKINTIYFGGGTPSILNPVQIGSILKTITKNYSIDPDFLETTLECNPGDFSSERITAYNEQGVNRIVLGLQTLNNKLHTTIGRSSSVCTEEILEKFTSIKGITHCIDIIYGIPGQTKKNLLDELNTILYFRPEHISAYLLSIDKGTRLYNRISLPKDFNHQQRILFETLMDKLSAMGYNHYEISNFSLPSFQSIHNNKYWQFKPYIGFGPGAHSFYNNERFSNPPSVEDYIIHNYTPIIDIRTRPQELSEYILTGMRLLQGISLEKFANEFNTTIPDKFLKRIDILKSKGYIVVTKINNETIIKLTREGIIMSDWVIYELTEMFI